MLTFMQLENLDMEFNDEGCVEVLVTTDGDFKYGRGRTHGGRNKSKTDGQKVFHSLRFPLLKWLPLGLTSVWYQGFWASTTYQTDLVGLQKLELLPTI